MYKNVLIIGPAHRLSALGDPATIKQHHFSGYEPPPGILLSQTGLVYVFDVEIPHRLRQLEACCQHQRCFGSVKWVYGLSNWFADLQVSRHRELAEKVLDAGAQILPQFGFGKQDRSRFQTGGDRHVA